VDETRAGRIQSREGPEAGKGRPAAPGPARMEGRARHRCQRRRGARERGEADRAHRGARGHEGHRGARLAAARGGAAGAALAAVEHKEFAAALADLDRFLAQNPGDREGAELKKLALYRLGQTALEEKKYDDSYRALTQLAKLQPDYQDVASLLPQARRQVIDRHYQEGIRLFREEKLPEAIAEWKIVLDLE